MITGIASNIKRGSDEHKRIVDKLSAGWTGVMIYSRLGVHEQIIANIKRDKYLTCELEGCDIQFFSRRKGQRFCCRGCAGQHHRRAYSTGGGNGAEK